MHIATHTPTHTHLNNTKDCRHQLAMLQEHPECPLICVNLHSHFGKLLGNIGCSCSSPFIFLKLFHGCGCFVCICFCTHCVCSTPRSRHLDFPGLELHRVMSLGMEFWESNCGPLKEQIVFLTAELFPQPMVLFSGTLVSINMDHLTQMWLINI